MYMFTFEENDSEDDDLDNTLTDNILPHVGSDQTFVSGVGLTEEEFIGRRLSSKSKRSKSIHD